MDDFLDYLFSPKTAFLILIVIVVVAVAGILLEGHIAPPPAIETPAPPSTGPSSISAGRLLHSVCLTTDGPDQYDRAFIQAGWEGLQLARDEIGFPEVRVVPPQGGPTGWRPAILACAKWGDAVINMGAALGDLTSEITEQYPEVQFVGVGLDYPDELPEQLHPNLLVVMFDKVAAGCVAGGQAAQASQSGVVGGIFGPFVTEGQGWHRGFVDCARKINPDVMIHDHFPGWDEFEDPALGQSVMDAYLGEYPAMDVLFQVSSTFGQGAMLSAAAQGVKVIGESGDQCSWLFTDDTPGGEHCLGSAVMDIQGGIRRALAARETGVTGGVLLGRVGWQAAGAAPVWG